MLIELPLGGTKVINDFLKFQQVNPIIPPEFISLPVFPCPYRLSSSSEVHDFSINIIIIAAQFMYHCFHILRHLKTDIDRLPYTKEIPINYK